ncbi:MAG: class I SAM-dependent methyltransferase [Acidobacteria bacterium]|nr:class I SAM-dependent methyltransferase [Acidobacteriota bacterium]
MSEHWNQVYDTREPDQVSWFESEPATSLELFDLLGVTPHDSVIDVGGGQSTLVERLRSRGHSDLTLLDVSASALAQTIARAGRDVATTLEADVRTWVPTRRYDVWHDRAVLHFLSAEEATHYAHTLRQAVAPHGGVIIGVFSPEGPTTCSGLEVTRYDAAHLGELLGEDFDVVIERRVTHLTPNGKSQSFQWIAARRRARGSSLESRGVTADEIL